MGELERIKEAQENAPSYFELKDDGADFFCEECNTHGRTGFVVTYTPDGKMHHATHKACLDPDWLSKAKYMGRL